LGKNNRSSEDRAENTIPQQNSFWSSKTYTFRKKKLDSIFGYKGTNSNLINLIDNNIIPTEVAQENQYVVKFIEKLAKGKVVEVDLILVLKNLNKV
jgi:hypothetical protein